MKRHELMRILFENGWYIEREGERHTILRHADRPGSVQVTRSTGNIPQGTALAILKNAGVKP